MARLLWMLAGILIGAALCLHYIGPHWESMYAKKTADVKSDSYQAVESALYDMKYDQAVNDLMPGNATCIAMSSTELAQARATLGIFESFPEISTMHIAAVKYFGEAIYRDQDSHEPGVRLCLPEDILKAAAATAIRQKMSLGDPDAQAFVFQAARFNPEMLTAVGEIGFTTNPGTYTMTSDNRPFARLALAHAGAVSSRWGKAALADISDKDDLGTSSAILAVAAGEPEGIKRTAQLIAAIARNNKVIRWDDRKRTNALVLAMALAGPKARPYIDSLVALSQREVESWAPPFGMLRLKAEFTCPAFKAIGGAKAEKVLQSSVCTKAEENASKANETSTDRKSE